eukprot:1881587-Lingulodinium_polyedra.AAC.1
MAAGARPAAASTGGGQPGTFSAPSPSSWPAGGGCGPSAARAMTRPTRRSRLTSTSSGGAPSRRSSAASPSPAKTS